VISSVLDLRLIGLDVIASASINKAFKFSNKDNSISGVVKGTTLSGHPLLTTLGNSLRVLCYTKYTMRNIP